MKTFGKIAGGLGLLLVLTSPITLLITTGSLTLFLVKLFGGLALLALWAVTNGQSVAGFARSAFFYSSSAAIGVVFVGLLVAANFIAAKRAPTWDLTRKKIYSLSPQTEAALASLSTPTKLLGFTEGTPPFIVEDLCRRYQALSDKFSCEFKDPRKAPDLTLKYQVRAGQPAGVLIKGEGTPGESHATLNLARLSSAQFGEQELTNGLIKLNTVGTQKLYFTQGHGEWPLSPSADTEEAAMASLAAVERVLRDEGYAPEPLNLVERGEVPRDASALVIAGARSRFTEPEVKALADFLAQGGRLVYLAEVGAEPGLDAVLARYGVQVDPGLVADARVNPENPFIVITPFFGEHPITSLLSKAKANVVLPTARSLSVLKEGILDGVTTTPVLLSTPYAWLESSISENPSLDSGEKAGSLPLGTVSTRSTAGVENKRSDEARVLVFGDSEIMVGAFGYDPDRNLVMNSLAWITMQVEKISIRPPDRDLSTIDLSPELFSTIRLLSMDLLPLLLIGVGLTIWLTRRAR
jgi:ABC-type uncharacterized transport system involved in gliding motility auxiliary subunit